MPSCSDFEFIDQYLSLKGQMESDEEHSNGFTDQRLPPFSSSLTGPEPDISRTPLSAFPTTMSAAEMGSSTASLPQLPNNFLHLENGTPFLDQLTPNRSVTTPATASLPPYPPPPQHSAASHFNIVSGTMDSGSTVTDISDQQMLGLEENRDFIDLDEQRPFRADACSVKPEPPSVAVKLEQQEDTMGMPGMGMGSEDGALSMPEDVREDLATYLFNTIRSDILQECNELNISPDPRAWSQADTMRWVGNVCRKNNLECFTLVEPDFMAKFCVPGETLIRMDVEEFTYRSPNVGLCLYQQLELWKPAMDLVPESTQNQNGGRYHMRRDHHQHHRAPVTTTTTTTPAFTNNNLNNNNMYSNDAAAAIPDYNAHHHHSRQLQNHHHHPRHNQPYHHYHHHRQQPHPLHVPLSSSPAPSTDSSCSTLSSSPGSVYPSTLSPSQDCMSEDVHTARRKCPTRAPGTHPVPPHVPGPHRTTRGKQTIHLWQFLRELLDDSDSFYSCIKWLDRARGIFKIEDSTRVAKLWGQRKNRSAMNYDKLSRSVRQYYKKGIIKKTEHSKRLVYQFCQGYL